MAIDKLGSVSGADVVKMKECGSVDTACSGPVSAYGDKIVEEKPTAFTQNTFDKYNEDDYDRFNTLLSGRNGAEAQKFAKVITSDVNRDYTKFKQEYPDSSLKLPEPPNPADFDKGTKGYNAYREALLLWKSECEQLIADEHSKLSQKEPEKQEPEPPKVVKSPINNEPKPVNKSKESSPKTNQPPVENSDLEKQIRKELEKSGKITPSLDYEKMAELWLGIDGAKGEKPKENPVLDPGFHQPIKDPFMKQ